MINDSIVWLGLIIEFKYEGFDYLELDSNKHSCTGIMFYKNIKVMVKWLSDY